MGGLGAWVGSLVLWFLPSARAAAALLPFLRGLLGLRPPPLLPSRVFPRYGSQCDINREKSFGSARLRRPGSYTSFHVFLIPGLYRFACARHIFVHTILNNNPYLEPSSPSGLATWTGGPQRAAGRLQRLRVEGFLV